MNPISAAELSRMQDTQSSAMFDLCTFRSRVVTGSDAYGLPIVISVETFDNPCGLNLRSSNEMVNGESPYYDASLRLPIGTIIDGLDEITVTHRYGSRLSAPLKFIVVGDPMRGPSGLLLRLKTK